MRFLLLISFFISSSAVFSQEGENSETVKWHSFTEGFELAKQEGKLVLVDTYTDWCGICKYMDSTTFLDSALLQFLDSHFICIKFNPELDQTYVLGTDTFKAEALAQSLAQSESVAYPTFFFFVPSRKEWLKHVGYIEVAAMRKFVRELVAYHQFYLEPEETEKER